MPIHIHSLTLLLHVYDVPTSLAFYRDLLGFEIVNTSTPFSSSKDDFGWCLLRLNNVELMLNNMYENNIRPDTPEPARSSVHRDTTLYFASSDLDTIHAHLSHHGWPATEPKVSYYGMRQIRLHDPDGYSLCFQWPA